MQHGCCWQVLVPVGHEQLHHGPLGPGRLARRARLRRRGLSAGVAAPSPGEDGAINIGHVTLQVYLYT